MIYDESNGNYVNRKNGVVIHKSEIVNILKRHGKTSFGENQGLKGAIRLKEDFSDIFELPKLFFDTDIHRTLYELYNVEIPFDVDLALQVLIISKYFSKTRYFDTFLLCSKSNVIEKYLYYQHKSDEDLNIILQLIILLDYDIVDPRFFRTLNMKIDFALKINFTSDLFNIHVEALLRTMFDYGFNPTLLWHGSQVPRYNYFESYRRYRNEKSLYDLISFKIL